MNKLRLNYLLETNLIHAWCGNPITWEEVRGSGVQGHPGLHETCFSKKLFGVFLYAILYLMVGGLYFLSSLCLLGKKFTLADVA